MSDNSEVENVIERPSSIDTLQSVGVVLFVVSIIGGVALPFLTMVCHKYCDSSYIAEYTVTVEGVTLGVIIVLSGLIQMVLFKGLAAVIEQLFEIRKNTSTQ